MTYFDNDDVIDDVNSLSEILLSLSFLIPSASSRTTPSVKLSSKPRSWLLGPDTLSTKI
jgi:hypothetical protein